MKIDIHCINDPKTARDIFLKNENGAYGHMDMKGWFELKSEYRYRMQKDIKWESSNADETGILRDFKKSDPEGTKIGKQCRKRVLEMLAKKSLEPVRKDAIEREVPGTVQNPSSGGAESERSSIHFLGVRSMLRPAPMKILALERFWSAPPLRSAIPTF